VQFEIRALKGAEGLVSVASRRRTKRRRWSRRAQGLAVLSARPRRALPALTSPFAARFPLLLFS